jgi:hypothetical protein
LWYEDEEGVKRRHYVDIFIPKLNRCIEVKSEYTAWNQGGENMLRKKESGMDMGYEYDIYVYDRIGDLLYIV